tara:strand:- start:415 stop:594 length:180 start_codon:yes stop_codon:yes gene_type:complete
MNKQAPAWKELKEVKGCDYCGLTAAVRVIEIPCDEDCAGGCGDKFVCDDCTLKYDWDGY